MVDQTTRLHSVEVTIAWELSTERDHYGKTSQFQRTKRGTIVACVTVGQTVHNRLISAPSCAIILV